MQIAKDPFFVCPSCQARNRKNARFCRGCGRSRSTLEAEKGKTAYQKVDCARCKQALRITDRFCFACGTGQPFRIFSDMKVCRDCNIQMPDAASYCPSCGNDVGIGSAAQIPVPVDIFRDEDPDLIPSFEC
ncbi:MAG: zinc ribbon domain-containing protein [Cyanobacteria bacterium]|nr:zinc ribbon domain-containing protein [Cyanobacteriota bacterium]